MRMFAIYERPDGYVVREWREQDGNIETIRHSGTTRTLDEARDLVPKGLYCTAPNLTDDPVIKEVWI